MREPLRDENVTDPKILERLRRAAPMLSANALKLDLYICFQADFDNGTVRATEEELLHFLANDRKALLAGFRELNERDSARWIGKNRKGQCRWRPMRRRTQLINRHVGLAALKTGLYNCSDGGNRFRTAGIRQEAAQCNEPSGAPGSWGEES